MHSEIFNYQETWDKYGSYIEALGTDVFLNLCEKLGGNYIYVPKISSLMKPARDRVIREKRKEGQKLRELKELFGISEMRLSIIARQDKEYKV